MALARATGTFIAAAFLATAGSVGAQAACADLMQAFDRAVASRSIDAARRAAGDIAADTICGEHSDEYFAKLVDFLVAYAGSADTPAADRQHALDTATKTLVTVRNWRLAANLGDYYAARRDEAAANHWYEQAVSFLASNPTVTATPAERHMLMTRLAAAKSLANDDSEGKRAGAAFVPTVREVDGSMGGIYSPALVRGAEVVSVPAPINFFTDETRFTPVGEKEFEELAQAVKEADLPTIKLVGHADPRGSAQHNMELSRRRVEVVRDRLLQKGIKSRIVVEAKGAQQEFDISVLPYRPSQEEIWQLDRRVEWVRGGLPE